MSPHASLRPPSESPTGRPIGDYRSVRVSAIHVSLVRVRHLTCGNGQALDYVELHPVLDGLMVSADVRFCLISH